MSKRKATEEFIVEARGTHGEKYDYSKVVYETALKKVCIVCPKHGEFYQKPISHIRGHRCPQCYQESKHTNVFGVGITDMSNVSRTKCYNIWKHMLRRCYEKELLEREPSYQGCKVCDEWLTFSNFKRWFDKHYISGYELDKDVLIKGNKLYSPTTCCFIPKEVNCLLTKRQNHRGDYPIGVHRISNNTFCAIISREGKEERIGIFKDIESAFKAYKDAKEEHIKYIANKYKDTIEEHVYNALMNYEVEITD